MYRKEALKFSFNQWKCHNTCSNNVTKNYIVYNFAIKGLHYPINQQNLIQTYKVKSLNWWFCPRHEYIHFKTFTSVGYVPQESILKFYAPPLNTLLMLIFNRQQKVNNLLWVMSYWKDANKNGLSQCGDVQTLIKYKNISHFTNFASKYYFCRIFRFWEKPFPWKCFYVPLFLKGWQPKKIGNLVYGG